MMAEKDIQIGDKVQWNYGAGHPQGTAAEIKSSPGERITISTKSGNTVTRKADEENPAVRVERGGEGNNVDVVKRMSELEKVAEGEGHGQNSGEGTEPTTGEKRQRDQLEQPGDKVSIPKDTSKVKDGEQEEKGDADDSFEGTDGKPKSKKRKQAKQAKQAKPKKEARELRKSTRSHKATTGKTKPSTEKREKKVQTRSGAAEEIPVAGSEGESARISVEETAEQAATAQN